MCKNSIKRLPAKLDRFLPNLARLRVSRNALEGALSDAVGRLTKLTTLELDGNDLTALPRDLSGLVSLVELNVSKNKLSAFPPSIGKCASLRVVNANDNALTSLPSEFFTGCVALEEFWCRGNRLEALPDALADAAALRKLDVGANALASFPDVAMLQVRSVQTFFTHRSVSTFDLVGPFQLTGDFFLYGMALSAWRRCGLRTTR